MSELADLRALLLGREIDTIALLRSETERLAAELEDPEQIVTRLSPLIARMLQRNIDVDPDAMIDTLSPIMAEGFERQIRTAGDALAQTLAPVIAAAIRTQIRTHRDDMVDALYPVIGNTVSKYVAQALKDLLDSINARMQRTFSFDALRRKIRAHLQGIPESELLLRESIGWEVEALFLIHKPTGLLMGERFADPAAVNEPEMVAAMLTAIRSFVNDWIARREEGAEINQIEYGGSTIYLEVAGTSYLAVVLKGKPGGKLVKTVASALSELIRTHAGAIGDFDGDRMQLPEAAIRTMFERIMSCRADAVTVPEKSYRPLYLLGGILAALAAYLGYLAFDDMRNRTASESLTGRFAAAPSLALYRVGAVVEGDRVRLVGAVPDPSLRAEAERIVRERFPQATIEDALVIARPFERTAVEQNADRLEAIQGAFALPATATRFYFTTGSAGLGPEDRGKLDFLHLLLRLNPEASLTLTGYSDLVGSQEQRIGIAQKRAQAVRRALTALGVDGARISIIASDALPEGIGPDESPKEKEMAEARCVVARFTTPAKGNL